MINEKTATIKWVLETLKRTPMPISPVNAALNNKGDKQPGYFNRGVYTGLQWSGYQDFKTISKDVQEKLITQWWKDERVEGITANAGWNGKSHIAFVDIDRKTFDSDEAIEQAVMGWENRHPEIKLCPKVKTHSGGYRYIMGFESIPKNWSAIINFTFTQGGEKSLGEVMSGPGSTGILPPTVGLKGKYEWVANALGEVPVFESPDKIGVFEVEKIITQNKKTYSGTNLVDEARDALNHIPVTNCDDYQKWINIGMACKDAGLDFEDWDNWSRGSKKYSTSRENLHHWNSFSDGGGITAATLFGFAKDAGWVAHGVQKKNNNKIILSKSNNQTTGDTTMTPEHKQKQNKPTEENIREALAKVENILLDLNLDDISKDVKVNQIHEDLGVSLKLWAKLISRVNKKIRSVQLELELKSLALIDDKIKLTQGVQDLSEKYRMGINVIFNLIKDLRLKNTTQKFESINLVDFFDEVSETIDYLIPGLLPKGESALLVASPKVGKSLLAIDLAFAVATGEDYFLGEKTQTGKVLLVSVDESKQSAKAKLIKRGFRKSDVDNIRIITHFEVGQLEKLEAEIEDFRPVLVIIDSLKRITKGSVISENSAEFSDIVYSISETCNNYGASCLLIHHSKKDNETIGVDNVRGSSAIVGACGNTWIMNRVSKEDPNNKKKFIFDPKDTRRQLYCYSRDVESKAFNLEFNAENNSWDVAGEVGISETEADERKTNKERIISVIKMNLPHHPEGLKGAFILDCLELEQPGGISKSSLYVELSRLVSAKVVGSKPVENSRGLLYFLHGYGNTTKPTQTDTTICNIYNSAHDKNGNIPTPPPLIHPKCNLKSETTTTTDFDLGYIHNKVGYKLVTSDFCNQLDVTKKENDVTNVNAYIQGVSDINNHLVTSLDLVTSNSCNQIDVTNGKAYEQGVSGTDAELVTSGCNQDVTNGKAYVQGVTEIDDYFFTQTQGGGGCAIDSVTNVSMSDNSVIHTTKKTDNTYSGGRSPYPPIDFDLLVDGDVIFDVGCKPYTLKSLTVEGWECTNGSYITKSNIQAYHHAPKSGWE